MKRTRCPGPRPTGKRLRLNIKCEEDDIKQNKTDDVTKKTSGSNLKQASLRELFETLCNTGVSTSPVSGLGVVDKDTILKPINRNIEHNKLFGRVRRNVDWLFPHDLEASVNQASSENIIKVENKSEDEKSDIQDIHEIKLERRDEVQDLEGAKNLIEENKNGGQARESESEEKKVTNANYIYRKIDIKKKLDLAIYCRAFTMEKHGISKCKELKRVFP